MSLGVVVKGTEGIVLAADSRVTITARRRRPDGSEESFNVNYDNTNKLITFSGEDHQHVGAITYGQALIGQRTPHSFVPELEPKLPDEWAEVEVYARRLSDFYREQWQKKLLPAEEYQGAEMQFIVAGYDPGAPYGRMFEFTIPRRPDPVERNKDDFGMMWGGEAQIVSRLVKGFDPQLINVLRDHGQLEDSDIQKIMGEVQKKLQYSFPYEVLPLQDCIDLAILLIRTTIDFQSLAIGVRGVGGMSV